MFGALAIPVRAKMKFEADNVVVEAGTPCRSIAAWWAVSIAVPALDPGADTVTVAFTVSVVRPSSPCT